MPVTAWFSQDSMSMPSDLSKPSKDWARRWAAPMSASASIRAPL